MSAKIGAVRVERNRAIQGQKDMRKTNRDQAKRILQLEAELKAATAPQGALTDALPPMPRRTIIYPDSDDRCYALAFTESQMHAYARQYAQQCIEARKAELEQECRSLSALVGDLDIQLANIEARNQQSVLTDAQIAAGAAILCDHGTPIGRNAAISVYDAMGGSRGGDAVDAARYRVIRDSADATFDAAVWIVTDSGARINVTSGTRSELDRIADAAIEQRKADKKGTV